MSENEIMTENNGPKTTPFLILGIILIVLGVVSIASPGVAGTAVVLVIGVLLLLAGLVQIGFGLQAEGWSHKLPPLIMGGLTVFAGGGVIAHPLLGLSILALLLAIFFVAEGSWKVVAAFNYRPASGWLAFLISGVLTLLLGVLIWVQWPLSGMWAVGILVGVDLLSTGVSLLALAATIKQLKQLASGAANES